MNVVQGNLSSRCDGGVSDLAVALQAEQHRLETVPSVPSLRQILRRSAKWLATALDAAAEIVSTFPMSMNQQIHLGIDLGAESGRVMAGLWDGGLTPAN